MPELEYLGYLITYEKVKSISKKTKNIGRIKVLKIVK